ncbi:MAG TPA: acyl-CoA dehydrogenase family protein [Acetobacteraceae bacterium]|nr:acyl-CoA dehydrogenase family protein [Acetobacteraceae bacterium]
MPTGATQAQPPSDIVAAAQALGPLIRAHRDEGEAIRHLPSPVADAFADAGLLQMYLPSSMGGPELPPLTVFQAIEALSQADGSAGWCAMIACNISAFLGWLPVEVGRGFAGCPANFRGAGSARPQGRAYPFDGGYRVRGAWNFASGVHHANWVMCTCAVMNGDRPLRTDAGVPLTRAMWVPAAQGRIADTWSVVGMRGTGSHDFVVEDAFVPEAHSSSSAAPPCEPGPLYHPRLIHSVLWTATAANALGIARGAIDAFAAMAAEASSTMSAARLRDRSLVQTRIAEAEAIVQAARAYVIDAVGKAWRAVSDGAPDLDAVVAQARLAIVHAMHEAVRAVDLVFHAAGTNAVYTRNPLERCFRDVHVAVQHAAGLPGHYEAAGKALLGLRPDDPGW